jgi:hypothetical protein
MATQSSVNFPCHPPSVAVSGPTAVEAFSGAAAPKTRLSLKECLRDDTMKPTTILALIVVLSVLRASMADLPIHCLHGQVTLVFFLVLCLAFRLLPRMMPVDLPLQTLGVWTFNLGSNTGDSSTSCGYESPDDNVQHFTSYNYVLKKETALDIELSDPNIATVVSTGAKGTWTMVYDEGFEVKVNGQVVCFLR